MHGVALYLGVVIQYVFLMVAAYVFVSALSFPLLVQWGRLRPTPVAPQSPRRRAGAAEGYGSFARAHERSAAAQSPQASGRDQASAPYQNLRARIGPRNPDNAKQQKNDDQAEAGAQTGQTGTAAQVPAVEIVERFLLPNADVIELNVASASAQVVVEEEENDDDNDGDDCSKQSVKDSQ